MIKVFSQPFCSTCVALKNELKKNNIEFEDINVIENSEARNEILDKGFRAVPIVKINEEYVVGLDKVKEMLGV